MKGQVIGCAAVVSLAGMSTACPPGECQEQVIEAPGGAVTWAGIDVALAGDASPGLAQGIAFVTDDQDSVQISVFNNEIKVMRNGKPVPADHVQHDDGVVRILDDNGQVVSEIEVALPTDAGQWKEALTVFEQPAEHPPVMLGITMGEPDEALRAHLGLGDRQVIMLDHVMDGLPAAEAGLKRFDIIVAIEGSDDGVSPSKLLDVLKGKQPGDELKLRILRGGQKETYAVKLRAYDDAALSSGESAPAAGELLDLIPRIVTVPSAPTAPAIPGVPAAPAAPSIDVEGILNKLRQQGLSDSQIDTIKKTLRQSIAQSRQVEIMRGPQGNMIIKGPDGQTRMIEIPDAWSDGKTAMEWRERALRAAPDRAGIEERLSAMEKRLDEMTTKMDERLERVLHRVEQLTEQLERRIHDDG
ncbi:MAG: PDZ domain-containing protein [Leptolyngbya sp. PLA3]|nr:MAG: PDZ domain-containing protein [Cyanobacteria bacterium CYA]MCE7968912.1 PDZ domain-containing protein [Leptolyngbya sp. PL-A3]